MRRKCCAALYYCFVSPKHSVSDPSKSKGVAVSVFSACPGRQPFAGFISLGRGLATPFTNLRPTPRSLQVVKHRCRPLCKYSPNTTCFRTALSYTGWISHHFYQGNPHFANPHARQYCGTSGGGHGFSRQSRRWQGMYATKGSP